MISFTGITKYKAESACLQVKSNHLKLELADVVYFVRESN